MITEQLRIERGWSTPNHMRRAAGALDTLTHANYGDILRYVADACDEQPPPPIDDDAIPEVYLPCSMCAMNMPHRHRFPPISQSI